MYTNIPSTYNNIFNTPRSMTNILLLIISCKKKIKLTMCRRKVKDVIVY